MEPFGLVPLEAMSCGLPVVATRVQGVEEVVTDGVNGFLSSEDPVSYAVQLERALEEASLELNLDFS